MLAKVPKMPLKYEPKMSRPVPTPWWRFNAQGYFWGMGSGIVAALVVPRLEPFKDIAPLYAFPPIFVVGLVQFESR